jgi:hypothetical protein
MIRTLVAAALVFATQALAADDTSLTARIDSKNYITIHTRPCTEEVVLSLVKKESRSMLLEAEMVYEGKRYIACWIAGPDGNVYILDEDGDLTAVPLPMFSINRGTSI